MKISKRTKLICLLIILSLIVLALFRDPIITNSFSFYVNNFAQNDAHMQLLNGNGYYNFQNYQQAIESYNKAMELNPKYAMAYYQRGIARSNLGDYKGAIEDYNKVIELDPKYVVAYNNRGFTKAYLKTIKVL